MYYIQEIASADGNYGNPSFTAFDGSIGLPDEMLEIYTQAKGFVSVTVKDAEVKAIYVNQEALDAYEADHPDPDPPTAAQMREYAYNTEKCVEWGGEMLTVTEAAQKWQYYAAEENEKAGELTTLIQAAKAAIREKYKEAAV